MNNLVLIDSTKLVPEQVFTIAGINPLIDQIEKEARSFVGDMSSPEGRKDIASMAHKVAKTKTYLDGLGKDLVSDWKTKSGKVDEARRIVKDRLDDLKKEVRKPLTDWENKEKERVESLKLRLEKLELWADIPNLGSMELRGDLAVLEEILVDDSWEEFKDMAIVVKSRAVKTYEEAIAKQEVAEKEKIELDKLRKEKEERDRKDREEKIAKDAARSARLRAELDAKLAIEKIEREKNEAIEREARIRVEAEEAKAKAERAKIEAVKREADLEARGRREAEEAEQRRLKSIKDAKEEERREVENKKRADQALTEAREKDKKHRGSINSAAMTDLMGIPGMDRITAREVIKSIALGKISNVKIFY